MFASLPLTPAKLSAAAKLVTGVALLALVSACASAPTDQAAKADYDERNDPIEPFNRVVFKVNDKLDKYAMKPVASAYRDYTPKYTQSITRNFLNNLKSPVILANDLLQGEWQRASDTGARFLVNSTIGFLGLGDVAGIPRHDEDMGQTFATYGSGEGAYLMLPFMGPSTVRDGIGIGVDKVFEPMFWLGLGDWTPAPYLGYSLTLVDAVDARSRTIKASDDIERTSIDFYATVRSLYRQRRNDEIRNGAAGDDVPAPDISYDDIEPVSETAAK